MVTPAYWIFIATFGKVLTLAVRVLKSQPIESTLIIRSVASLVAPLCLAFFS